MATGAGCGPSVGRLVIFLAVLAVSTKGWGQASYTAQVRGTLTDQSGAVVANATVTITNDGTNIAQTTHTDDHGEYFLTGLRPAVYVLKARAPGFRVATSRPA